MSPHWSQKGSKTMPHAEEHESSPPGYHSSPHAPAPPGHPARQSSLPLICISFMKTVPMSHSSISTSAGGRPPCICLLANARVRPMARDRGRDEGRRRKCGGIWRSRGLQLAGARGGGEGRRGGEEQRRRKPRRRHCARRRRRGGEVGPPFASGLCLRLRDLALVLRASWFRKVCGATGGSRLGILVVAFGNGIVLP